MPVAQVEYEHQGEDDLDDYVEGNHGDLVPMYYTTTKLQFRPPGRINIKCFGCGGPHKKIDCPNRMLPGAFLPLCGDCGPGHPVVECPLRIQARIPQVPTTPVNMIGTVSIDPPPKEPIHVLAITRARAQALGEPPDQPKDPIDRAPKITPLDYPDADLEIGRLRALQEWIDEERIKFEAKKARRGTLPVSEGGSQAEPSHSIRPEEPKANNPIPTQLKEVLQSKIQIPLSTLLECIPNLSEDLAAWVSSDRPTPLAEVECDFIEEGADRHNIALASWEGDASNVTLHVTHKNCKSISSIVDGGSGINIISHKLYDEWNLPPMEPTPFTIKLADQSKVAPLGLVKNVPVRIVGVRFLVAFVVMTLPSHNSSYSILARKTMA